MFARHWCSLVTISHLVRTSLSFLINLILPLLIFVNAIVGGAHLGHSAGSLLPVLLVVVVSRSFVTFVMSLVLLSRSLMVAIIDPAELLVSLDQLIQSLVLHLNVHFDVKTNYYL